ncbi:MAG: exosortase system-associated protein, TIGR04073 family [Victivallales bacterium]|nr:exosortase system-associated protein, TIGR04073 family [Victivallales bacterium]
MKNNRSFGNLVRSTLLVAVLLCTVARAEEEELFNLNDIIVKSELYVWNRISDVFDLFRVGIGAGGDIGVDLQVTKYLQLGGMVTKEHGVDFPHFIPPFWMVNYYENTPIFRKHEGYNASLAFLCWRREWNDPVDGQTRFERPDWDIRLELAALAHIYVNVSVPEIGDFLAGFAGYDPAGDDMKLDPSSRRRPADQFGRGISNILFGVVEVPKNVIRVSEEEGDLVGITKGLGLGVWRFLVREIVGVVEFVTFPFGWEPIIEPAYPFQKVEMVEWSVHPPSFQKRY